MAAKTPASAIGIARKMLTAFNRYGRLKQKVIAHSILKIFGKDWVYVNKNHNLAIVKDVLDEFEKLTPHAVWSRSRQEWRRRRPTDPLNKRMVK